jgi:hypothetical protein
VLDARLISPEPGPPPFARTVSTVYTSIAPRARSVESFLARGWPREGKLLLGLRFAHAYDDLLTRRDWVGPVDRSMLDQRIGNTRDEPTQHLPHGQGDCCQMRPVKFKARSRGRTADNDL